MYNSSVNQIKSLSLSQINAANSGHPGICLGFSEVMYVLYSKIANVHPNNSKFIDRDRVILSAGHGSAMLYSTLHLAGFEYTIEDLKQFRQINSKTPGHPEVHLSGVDASTGPLGQGVGNGVGMALGAKRLHEKFKEIDNDIFDNYVYTIVGDGCLNEGVSFESFSIASKLKLNNYIVLHDANEVTLDGPLSKSTSINEKDYFKSLGFDIFECFDVSDLEKVEKIILEAKKSPNPAYIKFNTVIGNGSKVAGTSSSHGAPLAKDDYENVMNNLKCKEFCVENEVYDDFKSLQNRSKEHIEKFNTIVANSLNSSLKDELLTLINNNIKFNWEYEQVELGTLKPTREIFSSTLDKVHKENDLFFAGSADISASTKVVVSSSGDVSSKNYDQNNLNFGIREFAMGCMANGLSSYNLKTITSTFLSFLDYMKSSLRVAALSSLNPIYVFSHDSVYVGEDGPTHQPIEQISNLRSIPNMIVIKPIDVNEAQEAIQYALNLQNKPVTIVTTRQEMKVRTSLENKLLNGAYFLEKEEDFDIQLLSTSSEIENCYQIKEELKKSNIVCNIINISSFELLEENIEMKQYLESTKQKNYSIELSSDYIWYKYANKHFGLYDFGLSAKADDIVSHIDINSKVTRSIINDFKN